MSNHRDGITSSDIARATVRELWHRGEYLYGRVELISGPLRNERPTSATTPDALVVIDLRIFPWATFDPVGWPPYNRGNVQIDSGPPRRVLSVRYRGRRAFLVVSREYKVTHDAHPAWVSEWCSNPDRCAWAGHRTPVDIGAPTV